MKSVSRLCLPFRVHENTDAIYKKENSIIIGKIYKIVNVVNDFNECVVCLIYEIKKGEKFY